MLPRMFQVLSDPQSEAHARLSRFAFCIAPSSDDAFSALDAMPDLSLGASANTIMLAFRHLHDHLHRASADGLVHRGQPPNSLIARFSYLPYHQRAAFALVVIEEFSMDEVADIMDLSEADVRSLLLATRDFLFAGAWTARSDA